MRECGDARFILQNLLHEISLRHWRELNLGDMGSIALIGCLVCMLNSSAHTFLSMAYPTYMITCRSHPVGTRLLLRIRQSYTLTPKDTEVLHRSKWIASTTTATSRATGLTANSSTISITKVSLTTPPLILSFSSKPDLTPNEAASFRSHHIDSVFSATISQRTNTLTRLLQRPSLTAQYVKEHYRQRISFKAACPPLFVYKPRQSVRACCFVVPFNGSQKACDHD